jgi:hypothetical protein
VDAKLGGHGCCLLVLAGTGFSMIKPGIFT